jgi:uncharacterized NAD(P)/FAD-binding protein YdhS
VTYRARGQDAHKTKAFDKIINCTGPSTNLKSINTALIQDLIQNGFIKEDELSLGMQTQDTAVISETGETLDWLSYIGPMLKAAFWEATAVPELRIHAVELSTRILIGSGSQA